MDVHRKKRLGAYYTCPNAAQKIADWVVTKGGLTILEPSFGSGVFVHAARQQSRRKFDESCKIIGAEISESEYESMIPSREEDDFLFHGNFMEMNEVKVDAVIGNPPYVRLRDLSPHHAKIAVDCATEILQQRIPESASLWMPFVLRAMTFLVPGGRMALVLPAEFLHVKYSRPLWSMLSKSFGYIGVARVKERMFPEILQDVVVLMCDAYGNNTDYVDFRMFETLHMYLESSGSNGVHVDISEIISGGRPFSKALVKHTRWREAVSKVRLLRVGEVCRFNVGYVSGDKEFFHPGKEAIDEYKIGSRSLISSISSSRALRGAGLLTSEIPSEMVSRLFHPVKSIGPSERAYISHGFEQGVAERYKCRVRDPWYVVPGVKVPDVVLNSFASVPSPLINDSNFAVSNSLLGGYLSPGIDANDFCGSWYNSLTLLSCELEIHSLGGGVMVLIPGEVAKIAIPLIKGLPRNVLNSISDCLRSGDVDSAYLAGDQLVLMDLLGMNFEDVQEIRRAVAVLRSWRLN